MEGWQKDTFYLVSLSLLSQQEDALLVQGCPSQETETMHSKLTFDIYRVRGLSKKCSEAKGYLMLSTNP